MKKRIGLRKSLSGLVLLFQGIYAIGIFLAFLDLLPLTYNGFGVDSAGRLYVGRGHHIEVWENGEQVNTIRRGTSRGYVFTVQEDDTILLASGNSVMVMDLEGAAILKEWAEERTETNDLLENSKYVFTDVTGERYYAGNLRGRFSILHGKTVIYQEPLSECVFGKLFGISIPVTFTGLVIALVKKRRDDPDYTPSRFRFDPPSECRQ